MISTHVKYENFEGQTVEEDLYFHLSKSDLLTLEVRYGMSFQDYVNQLMKKNDRYGLINLAKDIILDAYGVKTSSNQFNKTKEIKESFQYSPAFDEVLLDLMSDEEKFRQFLEGVVPSDVRAQIQKVKNAPQAI